MWSIENLINQLKARCKFMIWLNFIEGIIFKYFNIDFFFLVFSLWDMIDICSLGLFPVTSVPHPIRAGYWTCPKVMADSSTETLGTTRSLLVDSSVYDSRMAELSRDHVFLGLSAEDAKGNYCLYLAWFVGVTIQLFGGLHQRMCVTWRQPSFLLSYQKWQNLHFICLTDVLPHIETRVVLVGDTGNSDELLQAVKVIIVVTCRSLLFSHHFLVVCRMVERC